MRLRFVTHLLAKDVLYIKILDILLSSRGVHGRGGLPPRQSSLVLLGIRRSWRDAWTQEMGVLPLSGLNLNRNQTGQSGPYCKLRPTMVPLF